MGSWIVVGLVAGACGSGEGAVEECETVTAAYCRVLAACVESQGNPEEYERMLGDCTAHMRNVIACEDAESVSSSYEQCLADLAAMEKVAAGCDPRAILLFGGSELPLPLSCIGVIQLR